MQTITLTQLRLDDLRLQLRNAAEVIFRETDLTKPDNLQAYVGLTDALRSLPELRMRPVNVTAFSSDVSTLAYDVDSKTLDVVYKRTGKYRFYDVAENDYISLLDDNISIGTLLHELRKQRKWTYRKGDYL
jgi:hypothetical protein